MSRKLTAKEEEFWRLVLPHFSPAEVFSPDTMGAFHLLDVPFWSRLSGMRQHLDRPVRINFGPHTRRGVRSPREQLALQAETKNAADLSLHVAGKAADVSVDGLSPAEVAQVAERFGFMGIGIYPSFTHLDARTALGNKPTIFRRA